jgi:hypothetical protein
MASATTKKKTIPASILDMTANDLINALVESGETYRTIIEGTGLLKSDISRWRNGLRQASESKWRTLAKYALEKLEKI